MRYAEWEEAVPETIKGDSLWKMRAYRLALFLSDIGWYDVVRLGQARHTMGLADQLYRALGSISANLAEGYSRGTGRDRARFYEYALGSARESRDWYYKGRHVLEEALVQHRLELLTRVIRLLLTTIPQQRQRTLREERNRYSTDAHTPVSGEKLDTGDEAKEYLACDSDAHTLINEENLDTLLQDVPLPKP